MVEPSTTYEIGRMSVLVEHARRAALTCENCGRLSIENAEWLVCTSRRQNERFIGASAVAWCSTRESAQALARMLAGVEVTRDGAAIWPDGRTEPAPDPAHDLIRRLVEWGVLMGEWESPIWDEARAFLHEAGSPEPKAHPLCEGCSGKRYRLSTRDDGERAIERCDTCSPHMTDDDAVVLAGEEGKSWLTNDPWYLMWHLPPAEPPLRPDERGD